MKRREVNIKNIDLLVTGFILLLLFLLPVIFTHENESIAWKSVIKIWQDRILLVPLFAVNHWLLVPRLILRKRYMLYATTALILVATVTLSYYFFESSAERVKPPRQIKPVEELYKIPDRRPVPGNQQRPDPVPPYADLLLFSLLILSVDGGLSVSKYWHSSEEEKVRLEKESIQAQLGMLRNQVSPHFFMNTLNNIYSLIDADKERSKQSVMKLSRLMRYLLYENQGGYVKLSREFDFIRSYVDLMRIRFTDEVRISLSIPEKYDDSDIPSLLFVSFLENAFKHGTSYEKESFIDVTFKMDEGFLIFSCVNSRNVFSGNEHPGGIGLRNSRRRLDLLYGTSYTINVTEGENKFTVKLKIPLK